MASQNKYLVAVLTYRRPVELKRILDSLVSSVDLSRAEIVVIDNDTTQSAKPIIDDHTLSLWYAHEPIPGIASARNRALDFFDDRFTAMIFIDDDEWVQPSWFGELTSYAERTKAGVVQGPVLTNLPADAPNWAHKGQYFQRKLQATGAVLESASTNNVLLTRKAWVVANQPKFDDAFSVTGGSDYDFFWGIRKSGAVISYCAEAIVYEDVPAARINKKWIRRRYTRIGIGILRSHRKHGESIGRLLGKRAVALVSGVLHLMVDLIRGKGMRAAPMERILKSVGVFLAVLGYRIHEYKR